MHKQWREGGFLLIAYLIKSTSKDKQTTLHPNSPPLRRADGKGGSLSEKMIQRKRNRSLRNFRKRRQLIQPGSQQVETNTL